MQTLARSKGRVPDVLGTLIANFGTLVVHSPDGKWHYFGKEWLPVDGLTSADFIRVFHAAPPSNVPLEWWGIVPNLTDDVMCRDAEWTAAEVQAVLDAFVEKFSGRAGGPKVHGRTIRHMSKAKHLAQARADEWDRLITPAPTSRKPRRHVRTRVVVSNL